MTFDLGRTAMAFVLVVRAKTKSGRADEAAALLSQLAAKTREEPGCLSFVPCRDPDEPDSFLLFEQYVDKEAFDSHAASEHVRVFVVEGLFELYESREPRFYQSLV
jgi:quinol monooxygenase YgiN